MVQADPPQTLSTEWSQNFDTHRHIDAHGTHRHTLEHIETSHTRYTVRQRKGPIWLESLFCPVCSPNTKRTNLAKMAIFPPQSAGTQQQ